MLTISVCATKNYTYAMRAQARRVLANCQHLDPTSFAIVIVGDSSREIIDIRRYYEVLFPASRVVLVSLPDADDSHQNYKEGAQLLIARLRSAAHSACLSLGADQCWSLDSDVLPPPNALRCMQDMLRFDNGYYSISTCPYPNAAFLGGFGTRQNPIAEDFTAEERILTDELKAEYELHKAEIKSLQEAKKHATQEQIARWDATNKKIRECPPDGTIWEVIAKHGWRRRGWFDHAYPGIGLGSVVPSDWCGFGCTLMNRQALALASFDGYEGKGTEDLFVCWNRWAPAGLRINVIPHCPCDHIVWGRKKAGEDPTEYTHMQATHEPEGEFRGHLRTRSVPWINLG